jgi:GTPase SAR1 family protein
MVVGNKIDVENERRVPTDRPLREYKEKFDIDCWEVSAKTGYNVREIFAELLESL